MVRPAARNALGFGALGLSLGVLLLPVFYLTTVRTQLAVRGDPLWAFLFIGIMLAPAAILAVYGWARKPPAAEQ